ncbi:hypothetical protein ANN_25919 [Periplaneta americana]|uniref:Uncharacterized protein n=1 Tax=Periplaneta americana TaxID=6978 RepID=A0ABQ8S4G8_PERAM|nr:hypothetical protein ANN_25919 [Periplaneta americana]
MAGIDALDSRDSSAVAALKSLPTEQLVEDILFIDSNFKIVSKSITLLEPSKLKLSEALNIVDKVSQTVIQNNNSLVSEKVKCMYFPHVDNRNSSLQHVSGNALFPSYGLHNIEIHRNPRATVPSHHQVRFSLNMWAGIIGDRLVGPHVLVNRLTGQAYTNFLENTIPHVLEDTPLINRQHIHFLHDGAPAHFSRTARRYLDRRFPDRCMGRGGPIAWPPRSPDLNPLDFYLWGHLKSLVYSSPVPDLESLRNRIVACSEDKRNTPGVWDRVRRSMRHRCEVCIQVGGGHFEHLL